MWINTDPGEDWRRRAMGVYCRQRALDPPVSEMAIRHTQRMGTEWETHGCFRSLTPLLFYTQIGVWLLLSYNLAQNDNSVSFAEVFQSTRLGRSFT